MKILAAIASVVVMGGCATTGSNFTPLVDLQGRSPLQYDQDVVDCKAYALQKANAAQGAAAGAMAAALLGAFLAPRGYRNEVAGKSAVLGGISGAGGASNSQENVIRRCLAGRGYNVLD